MSICDALKDLCQKVTGQESTGETIEEVIRDMTEHYPEDAKTEQEDIKTEQE